MDKIIFVTGNFARKEEFQLRTLGIKKDKKIYFKKVAIGTNSELQLAKMHELQKYIKKNYTDIKIADSWLSKNGRELNFEYIDGSDLESILLEAILQANNDKVHELIKLYESLLSTFITNNE